MQIQTIKEDVHYLCGSTSATYENTDLTRNINIAYQDVSRIIWESASGWQYDDSNATNLPVGISNLVHSQQDYTLPSTAQRLERVEVKDGAGNWLKLTQRDIHDFKVSEQEEFETDGTPVYYDVVGRSLILYPAPHSGYTTLASGLAVYVNRDITDFATSATTTEPGFATPFHRILSYAAAIDFSQDESQRKHFVEQKARLEAGLKRFYSRRNVEGKVAIKPLSKRQWRNYI